MNDELKDAIRREFFETPLGVARFGVQLFPDHVAPFVLDPGAGSGIWGQAVRERYPKAFLIGNDLPGVSPVTFYDEWLIGDFLLLPLAGKRRVDFIVCNPPYSKAQQFIVNAHKLLVEGGIMVFFLRLAFLAGINRRKTLWRHHTPKFVIVSARRPSFTNDGRTDTKTEYAMFVWEKGWQGNTTLLPPFDYQQFNR